MALQFFQPSISSVKQLTVLIKFTRKLHKRTRRIIAWNKFIRKFWQNFSLGIFNAQLRGPTQLSSVTCKLLRVNWLIVLSDSKVVCDDHQGDCDPVVHGDCTMQVVSFVLLLNRQVTMQRRYRVARWNRDNNPTPNTRVKVEYQMLACILFYGFQKTEKEGRLQAQSSIQHTECT